MKMDQVDVVQVANVKDLEHVLITTIVLE